MNKVILSLLILFFLAACDRAEGPINDSYPPPTNPVDTTQSYPPPVIEVVPPESYPPPPPVFDESKRFVITEPVNVGDTIVSGTGPANVAITIISVSDAGQVLGAGIIGADGTYSFEITPPLRARQMIGIQLGDKSLEPAYSDAPGLQDLPLVGRVLATAVTR